MSDRARGRGRGGQPRGGAPSQRGQDFRGGARGGSRGGGDFRGGGRGGDFRGGGRGGRGVDVHSRGAKIFSPPGENAVPSKEVNDKEDETVQANKLSLARLDLSGSQLPLRPGYGTEGRKIVLRTNYFSVNIDPHRKIFKYEIKIKGPKNSGKKISELAGRKRRTLFSCLFRHEYFHPAFQDQVATDYAAILIASKALELGPGNSRVFEIAYREPEERVQRPNPDIYHITIETAGTVQTGELLRYLASSTTDPSDFAGKADAIQALQIIIAHTPNANPLVFQAGHNKFFEQPMPLPVQPEVFENYNLTGGLMAIRGYYSSIRTSTSRILLNLNAQCSPFFPSITMDNLMMKFGVNVATWLELEKFISRLRVKTRYLKEKDGLPSERVKTVIGFSHAQRKNKKGEMVPGNAPMDHGNAEQISFRDDQGRTKTVQQFFKEKHTQVLRSPKAWLLNCGTVTDPVWLPPELCLVMPGQPYRRKLSEEHTTAMLNIAARPPAENCRRIVGEGLRIIGASPQDQNACLNNFGLQIGTSMIVVPARVLIRPSLIYGKQQTASAHNKASWNLANKIFYKPMPLKSWAFAKLGGALIDESSISEFKKQMKVLGLGIGTQNYDAGIPVPLPGGLRDEEAIDKALDPVFERLNKENVLVLLVVLPKVTAVLYARVKYFADVKYGIHTVCVVSEKTSKGPQYWANVALKFNLKLGGVNHIVPQQALRFLAKSNTMIVGIDVAHPSIDSIENAPSIAGVVASVDETYAQWPASVRTNTSRREMVDGLADMIEERLNLYLQKNKQVPSNIMIYRDGVSEGQYAEVLSNELDKIQEGTKRVYTRQGVKKPLPKFTIIVAGKRHHTRLYPTQEQDADDTNNANPPGGTVVDRGITMEKGFDFYLQAHHALVGTARPTHYVVIKDDMGLGADALQNVTHALCFLFGRATKAVSLCPPAYYADLLCERGRKYLSKYLASSDARGQLYEADNSPWTGGVHERLKNSMFYI